jgi:hypothetical protein
MSVAPKMNPARWGEPGGALMPGRRCGRPDTEVLAVSRYWMIWTMRRLRGSTSTVRPFTTV